MPKGMQAIYSQTASGSSSTITFNNIPQTFTDLQLMCSARSTSGSSYYDNLLLQFNGSTSGYSMTRTFGDGAGNRYSDRFSGQNFIYCGEINAATATANGFGIMDIVIPNYRSNLFKQIGTLNVNERDSLTAYTGFKAGMWQGNAPVTSISLLAAGGNWASGSTFTLYGIGR